jgi:hypothetical protein
MSKRRDCLLDQSPIYTSPRRCAQSRDEAQSELPALGYTVPYAVGNIVLTPWGPVIVALLSIGK